MRIFNDTNGCSSLISKAGKKLLATTAMTAVGLLAMSGTAEAGGSVGDYDVWEFGSFQSGAEGTITGQSEGYVQYSGDRIIGDLVQEDIGRLGHVDLKANLTVATGVESGVMKILGKLTSTGQVFVLDVNGFLFGSGSVVDTASFAAIGGSLGEGTDLSGDDIRLDINVAEGAKITIRDGAQINVAEAGLAAFVAPTIINNGIINAKMGTVVLASGEKVTLDMYGDGLVEVVVDGELADGLIKNRGKINAQGGNVLVTAKVAKTALDNVINMGGVVNVSSATVKGGKIILSGGSSGKVFVKGKLKASGKDGMDAGSIEVAGKNIEIHKNARLTADGSEGSAAGDINVTAEDGLVINGKLSAQGLAGTGYIETSAPNVAFGLGASILATREWLLDPTDLDIDAALAALLEGQLAIGNMTVQTPAGGADQGNIGVHSVIDWATSSILKLIAHGDIFFGNNGGVSAAGAGSFVAEAGDDFRMIAGNEKILMNGGNVEISTVDEFTIGEGFILAGGGDITIDNGESFEAVANSLRTSGIGKITVNQNKDANGHTSTTDPSIQNAVDAISNTGTGESRVNVGAGTWAESVNINKAITVIGHKKTDTFITPGAGQNGFTIDGTIDGNVALLNMNISGGSEGVRVNDTADVRGLIINKVDFTDNALHGVAVYGDSVGSTVIKNSNFLDNGAGGGSAGEGDILFYLHNGNIKLQNIDIQNNTPANTADYGIQIRGSDTLAQSGKLKFINVKVSGDYRAAQLGIQRFTGLKSLSMTNVELGGQTDLGTDSVGWGSLYFSNIGAGDFSIGNTSFNGGVSPFYQHVINDSVANFDATGATFDGIAAADLTVEESFGVEDKVFHALDDGSKGLVTWQDGNVFVTQFSGSIQRGVDASDVGGNVWVDDGTFAESVNVNKAVNLFGNNHGVHGSNAGRGDESIVTPNSPGFLVTANDVVIDGFKITGADDGIFVDGADDVTIKNNIIKNATNDGVHVDGGSNVVIKRNKIKNTDGDGIDIEDSIGALVKNNLIRNIGDGGDDNGIEIENSDNAVVVNNIINGVDDDGIDLDGSEGALIKGNTIKNTDGDGIDIEDSIGALVKNNLIRNIGDGGDDNGIEVEDSDDVVIANNIINDVDDDGIDLDGSEDALIKGNEIGLLGGDDNIGDDGIDLDDSEGATIRDNKIQNTVENGIDVRGSDNTDIINNTIRLAGLNGVYVNPSDYVRILDNTITDVDADGIHVEKGYDIRVRRNTVRRTGDDGIDINRNDRVRVTGNTVTDTDRRGISVERAYGKGDEFSVVVRDNTVKHTGRTGIVVDRFTTARVVDNTVRDSNRAGIRVQRGDYARIRRNDIRDTRRHGIRAENLGEVDIRRNVLRDNRWDGINLTDFGYAWIAYNDVRNTGDDNIDVSYGEYVAIYDNILRKAGFFGEGAHADEAGADAISVTNVGGGIPMVTMAALGEGYSSFGFDVEIIGNDINKTYDDGIEVVDSGPTWVSDNIIRHAGYGDGGSYGGGDYYGADAIHLRNVNRLPYGLRVLDEAATEGPDDGYYPQAAPWDYASVVIYNDIRKTADDGIEVVGGESYGPVPVALDGGDGAPMPYPEIESGRTLVAWNDIRHAGDGLVGDGGDGLTGDGGDGVSYGYAPDGYGADAIHVRGIHNGGDIGDGGCGGAGDGAPTVAPEMASIFSPDDFAVEVLENYIWNTGDDGIEVRDSGRTRVAGNDIHNTGLATSDTEAPVWDFGWDFGANDGDGIHIENVYAGGGGMTSPAMHGGSIGNSVEVLGNTIDHTGDDGVEVHYSGRTLVADNTISNSGVGLGDPYYGGDEGYGHDAIHVGGVYDDYGYYGPDYSVRILNNVIDTTGDDGVEVHYAGRTLIKGNDISHVGYGGGGYYGYGDENGADAIHVMHVSADDNYMPFSVDIRRNTIDITADDGIEVAYSGRTRIKNNTLTNIGHGDDHDYGGGDIYGADGIHVRNIHQNSYRPRRADVRIINNDITDTSDDGIESIETDRVVIKRNTVDQAGDDGISVLRYSPFAMGHPTSESTVSLYEVPSKAVIKDNVVTNSGTPFPEETEEGSEDTFSFRKRKRRFGGDGIEVAGFDKIIVEGNDVSDSVENGLFVSGPDNGKVIVSDNVFTDNDIGMHFQSGEIDLTGERNTLNGGRIGMRFAPAEIYGYPDIDAAAQAAALPIDPTYAPMSLVGNTIGAQTFNGQSDLYVELDNGAFFNPGTPTLLNALDSTYQGTPFGTFTPSVDYAGGFPLDVVAFLESKFFHFNDDGTLGLFFFPLLPEIDQEDIFNYFGPNAGSLSGLNVTILGLPGIPGGTPVALNSIAPAAGGDTSPEALNAIETAAGGDGGEESSCWNDALNTAGSGQIATVSYGGSAEDLLNSEASCGS